MSPSRRNELCWFDSCGDPAPGMEPIGETFLAVGLIPSFHTFVRTDVLRPEQLDLKELLSE